MGPKALKLLISLVRQTDETDPNCRSVNIFYDNAQNVYRRRTPIWSELGLDMRGRSTIMKESFRSTLPITEYALNVLYRLQPPDNDADHKELVRQGLIEATQRDGEWWNVRFNQINGPKPEFRQFKSRDQEFDAIAAYCCELIRTEGVQPSDICLIYNGQDIKGRIQTRLAAALGPLRVEVSVQTGMEFNRHPQMLLATTPQSFKGFESEVVIIVAADRFTAQERGILANNLYVAMTRARSVLTIFAKTSEGGESMQICTVLKECLDSLHATLAVDERIRRNDDLAELLDIIGSEHREWLDRLFTQYRIVQEPLVTEQGEVIAEPLFWFQNNDQAYVCFGPKMPAQRVIHQLEDGGFKMLRAGESLPIDRIGY